MKFKLCASKQLSVAMKIEDMGYGLHGHDIDVEVCVCLDYDKGLLDIEYLDNYLESLLKPLNRKPLWETVGNEGKIEDLLIYIRNNFKIEGLCELKAIIQNKEIYLEI
ncbi:MAG: hypothetical protein ACP5I6_05355 [Caldisphaera sp.]|jgi:6-pyruvoyl-tetrahydropterin synthase|nr:MAG: hypothetical protein C0171_04595 [Caldisphaera sp.]